MKKLVKTIIFWAITFGITIPLINWGFMTDHLGFAYGMSLLCGLAIGNCVISYKKIVTMTSEKPTIGRFIILPDEASRVDDNMANVGLQLYANPAEVQEKVVLIEIDDRRGVKP